MDGRLERTDRRGEPWAGGRVVGAGLASDNAGGSDEGVGGRTEPGVAAVAGLD